MEKIITDIWSILGVSFAISYFVSFLVFIGLVTEPVNSSRWKDGKLIIRTFVIVFVIVFGVTCLQVVNRFI